MEWLWVAVLAVVLIGPIVFVALRRRNSGHAALLRDRDEQNWRP